MCHCHPQQVACEAEQHTPLALHLCQVADNACQLHGSASCTLRTAHNARSGRAEGRGAAARSTLPATQVLVASNDKEVKASCLGNEIFPLGSLTLLKDMRRVRAAALSRCHTPPPPTQQPCSQAA